jgi:hypothetical protein
MCINWSTKKKEKYKILTLKRVGGTQSEVEKYFSFCQPGLMWQKVSAKTCDLQQDLKVSLIRI